MVCSGRVLATVASVIGVFHVQSVQGNVLGKSANRPLVAASWTHTKDIRKSLDEVITLALGKDQHHIKDVHLGQLRTQLQPLFVALPKNAKGLLGHSTVRYALHRHFVHHHGMYVRGFEPRGEAWNSSSPVDIMEDKVPSYVQHLFEERLQDGFDLHEMALLAATLEHFVHMEARDRLLTAYRIAGHTDGLESALNSKDLAPVMDGYMAMFINGGISQSISDEELTRLIEQTAKLFPPWADNQAWLRTVEEDVLQEQLGGARDAITFSVALKIVEAVTVRYGKYQNYECRDMAKKLNTKERKGTGRMPLQSFHKLGWQFQETEEYLRELGALDDRYRPSEGPWVVIPNYVVSVANCIASSSIYSVCCMDSCEEMLRQVELKVGAPIATPEVIINLIATIPSATVNVPRGVSQMLVNHLNEIAADNNGHVPLHGRLFSQWMHHAYPRECVFPVVSGTTQPLSPDDWMISRNVSTTSITREEMDELMSEVEEVHVKDLADGDMEETLPWDEREELVFHRNRPSLAHELQVLMRAVALIGAIYGFVVMLAQVARSLCPPASGKASV